MFNLTISPPQTEIAIKPGTSFTQAYSITNNGDQPVYLNTSVKQWTPQDNTSQITYSDYLTPDIKFSLLNANLDLGQTFLLKAGDQIQVVLKANIDPKSIGDSYYTFFINQVDNTSPQTIGASGQIGAHLLISTSSNLNQPIKFSLKELKVLPKFKDIFFTPISFQIELDNPTDYFQKPVGDLVIQKSGKDFRTLPLDSQNILANHSRLVYCQDNPTCTIRGPFWPGPYTASIKLDSYSSPPQTFVVLPLSPLILIAFLVLVYFLTKKTKKLVHKSYLSWAKSKEILFLFTRFSLLVTSFYFLIAACAPASLAIGTR